MATSVRLPIGAAKRKLTSVYSIRVSTVKSLSQNLILVIDDDPDFQAFVGWKLESLGYAVCAAYHPSEIDEVLGGRLPQAIILDWQLGDTDGTKLIGELRQEFPLSSVVFVTGFSTPDVAAAAIKLGAVDFLTKPLDEAKLAVTLATWCETHELRQRLRDLERGEGESALFEGMIGVSPQMRTVFSIIRNVAPTDVNVMICGESGTGKELAATAIHHCSDRATGPFVAQNMASIPADLAEATLFGHEKGAFTGADRERQGAVGEAAGGTLFLDEITEMPLALQGKLLRFLQERTYRPVGGRKELKSDVRIISATNRDPLAAVHERHLREDLYYRLNVVPLILPPLRERDGDMPLLVNHLLRRFSKQYHKKFTSVESDAMQQLKTYAWPGNVRQLIHLLQRVVILNDGDSLTARMLPPELFQYTVSEPSFRRPAETATVADPVASSEISRDLERAFLGSDDTEIVRLDELERRAIERAIRICDGSAYEAARKLGISSATIYRKIKMYQISPG